MGYKFDEKTKCWVVYYSKRNPKTGQPVSLRRTSVKSEIEAKKVERELIARVQSRIEKKVHPRWNRVLEMYLDDCDERGLTKKSIYNAKKCLEAATLDVWGERSIASITTRDIKALIQHDYAHCSETHRKGLLKFIRGVFRYAAEEGMVDRNPAPNLKFKSSEKIKLVLTESQVRKFLQKAIEYDWEWYPHCTFALYTGMRNGELFALTWDKVSLENRQILVNQSWNNKDGFKSTKSGDDRIVEIAPSLIPLIKELKLQTFDTGFVLPRLPRWKKGEQARELRLFLLGIGLPQIRFHDLRATWATIMLGKGIEPAKVMFMGGWKDMKTMMVYLRKAGISIRGITDGLELHNHSAPKMASVSYLNKGGSELS